MNKAYIERVLGLPHGTVERWTTERETSEDRALRRLIERFPWLLDVADRGFEPEAARQILLLAASDVCQAMAGSKDF